MTDTGRLADARITADSLRLGFQPGIRRPDEVARMVRLLDLQDAAPGVERLRSWALAVAAPAPGWRVVDVGCGTGTVLRRLAALVVPGGSAVGVEPNPLLREVATGRHGSSAALVEGVAGALPIDDASVDLVWCERVLQHLHDPQAAVDEMFRVLRPGGCAVILDSDHGTRVSSDIDLGLESTLVAAFIDTQPNPRAARAVPRQLKNAGLILDPDIGSAALILPPEIALQATLIEISAAAAVAAGTLTQSQADQAVATHRAAAADGVAFSSVTIFGFIAHKPGPAGEY